MLKGTQINDLQEFDMERAKGTGRCAQTADLKGIF